MTHLHCHSSYSMLDGAALPEQMVARLKELGHDACAVTDHGNTYAHRPFQRVMRAAGLKPIFGLEAYQVASIRDLSTDGKKVKATDEEKDRNHVTLLAATEQGYRNLLMLNKLAWQQHYVKPVITWDQIIKHQEGLTVLSGCIAGDVSKKITAGYDQEAWDLVLVLQQRIERFYLEIVPCPSLDFAMPAARAIGRMSEMSKVPLVLTNDAHFAEPTDYELEDLLVCIGLNKTVNDPARTLKLPEYHYMCDSASLVDRALKVMPEMSLERAIAAVEMTATISDSIDFELPVANKAAFPISKKYESSADMLRGLIKRGKSRRYKQLGAGYFTDEKLLEYDARLDYELQIIADKDFQDYFLIVADIVQHVMHEGRICAARGSAAGSLVCWLLEITQIDPVRFGLPFERFMNPDRTDYPDIDLDFPKDFRASIFQYLTDKYGADNVGHVAALSYFRSKQAILDVGKAYDVPFGVIRTLSNSVPSSMGQDAAVKTSGMLSWHFADSQSIQWILDKYPKMRMAEVVEGQIRHSTIHAAGYVVSGRPIHEVCGVGQRQGELPIIQGDKEDCSDAGLLKIDVLSLGTLGVIDDVLHMIGKDLDWVLSLPLDDAATYQMLSRGEATGIFQLQGNAATGLMKQMRPKNLDDIAAISVLARPGPLQSGGAAAYIEGYHGRAKMPEVHPLLAAIVRDTYGQVIYQEQVMSVARDIGGFSWADVHKVRKMITSTSYGASDLQHFKAQYLLGAQERLVPAVEAEWAWNQCEKSGGYVFNKAHAYSYAMIGYWTAYLKCHYAAFFTATTASSTDDEAVRIKLLSEFRKGGGAVKLLDHSKSKSGFTAIDSQTLVGGFSGIVGIGPKTAEKLIAGQPYASWEEFFVACGKATGDKLRRTGVHTDTLQRGQVSLMAPWYLDTEMDPVEQQFFSAMYVKSVAEVELDMALGRGSEEVRIGGKIVSIQLVDRTKMALKYGGTAPGPGEPNFSAKVTVVDDTGSIMLNYSAPTWEQIMIIREPGQGARGDGTGNTVMVTGTISRDCARVFGSDLLVVTPLDIPQPDPEVIAVDVPSTKPKRIHAEAKEVKKSASSAR